MVVLSGPIVDKTLKIKGTMKILVPMSPHPEIIDATLVIAMEMEITEDLVRNNETMKITITTKKGVAKGFNLAKQTLTKNLIASQAIMEQN